MAMMKTGTKKAIFEEAYYSYVGYGFADSWDAWKEALENDDGTAQDEWDAMSKAEQGILLKEYDKFLDLASSKAKGGLKAALSSKFGPKGQRKPRLHKQTPPTSIREIRG